MAKMPIRVYGDPLLRRHSKEVTEFDESLEALAVDMVETMLAADGIGLAAPQVGVSRCFIVIGIPVEEDDGDARKILVLVNPEILEVNEETVVMEEGCLSLPGITEEIERPTDVRVRYQNLKGETLEIEVGGLLARVIQHEKDHLDGVLFIDHLPPLKRTLLRGKLKKLREEHEDLQYTV
ncbi:MAG TPA: peptide deformylase [Bacteroidetes bacterium]|nr:peptide deformylase [Bacteroidota bacterium]